MSCWVVPSVAAEYWGVSISQIIEKVRRGEIPSKTELGFQLVDVAPQSQQMGGNRPKALRPQTYVMTPPSVILSSAERKALLGGQQPEQEQPAAVVMEDTSDVDSNDRLDWRPTRAAVGRTRKPPRCQHLAA